MNYGWILVTACVLISAYYSGVVFLGFTAAFEPLVKEFGWSYTQISFVTSLRGFETGLLVPVAGILMDRWGARILLASGAVIAGIGLICLSHVHTLLWFFAWFVVLSIGSSTATTALLMAAITGWFKKNLGLATGIAASGVAVGGALIPFVTLLIDNFGWRNAMLFMGLGMWLIPMPLAFLFRRKWNDIDDQKDREHIPVSETIRFSKKSIKSLGAREALRTALFWKISICYLCQRFAIGAVITHIMPFFTSVGFERTKGSLFASILPIMTVVGRIGFGWMGDRVGTKMMTAVSMAFTSLGALFLAFISNDNMWIVIPFIATFGIGWGGSIPMLNGMLRNCFGSRNIASIVGFSQISSMAGIIIGAPLVGWIYDISGRYLSAWLLLAAITGLSTITFIKYVKQPTREFQ